jgi:hypothetical protein
MDTTHQEGQDVSLLDNIKVDLKILILSDEEYTDLAKTGAN